MEKHLPITVHKVTLLRRTVKVRTKRKKKCRHTLIAAFYKSLMKVETLMEMGLIMLVNTVTYRMISDSTML